MYDALYALLEAVVKYTVVWCAVVGFFRRVFSKRSDAASCISLTYCASAVVWGSLTVLGHYNEGLFPEDAWKFPLPMQPTGFSAVDFLGWTGAYFATDLYFDWDPRFVTHHLLSLAAMTTTFLNPHLQGTFTITAIIAEVGGVMFHVSKLSRTKFMTMAFLCVYSFTRLVCFPVFVGWLFMSFSFPESRSLLNLWAAVGTTCLVGINVSWCFKQWQRYFRLEAERAKGVLLPPSKLPLEPERPVVESRKPRRHRRHVRVHTPCVQFRRVSAHAGKAALTASGTVVEAATLAWDMMS